MDLIITGISAGGKVKVTYLYKNVSTSANDLPSVPGSLTSVINETAKQAEFTWDKASDNQTSADGLYYEIRAATETISDSLAKWVISPSTGKGTGSAGVQTIGNYPHGYVSTSPVLQAGMNLNVGGGTTYYWQVRAIDTSLAKSAWSAQQQIYCPLFAPADFKGTVMSSDTIKWEWADTNSGEEGYRIYSSTDWLITTLPADTTEWMETDLTANTSSYVWKIKAYKGTEESAASSLSEVLYSSANAPAGTSFYEIWATSATVDWTANGNREGTEYAVQISTSNGFEVSITTTSPWQTALSYEFTSLDSGTTYYTHVRARNGNEVLTGYDSVVSTKTLAFSNDDAPSDFAGVAISSTQVQFSWIDNADDEDGFKIYTSTAGLLATVGANVTTWTDTSLTANTSSYAWQVRAYNIGGESAGSTLSEVVYSSANVPTGSYYYETWPSSATYAWDATGNSAGTKYLVQISSNSDFSVVHSASPWQTTLSYEFTSLLPNTTYYGRVKARNGNDIETAYAKSVSTMTLASIPVMTAFTSVSSEAVTAVWDANSNPAGTEYAAQISTSTGFEVGITTTTSWQTALSYEFTSLSVNTTYYSRAKARNANDIETGYATEVSTMTWAVVPAISEFTSVSSGSAVGNWTANGNLSGTEYRMQVSDDQGFASITEASPWQTALSYEFTSLAPNTTYYGKVEARNDLNVATGYSISESTLTLASVPVMTAFTSVSSGSVVANWNANNNPSGTEYWVQISTKDDFTPLTAENGWQTELSYEFTSLSVNTTYYSRVKARNANDIETGYAIDLSTMTLAVVPEISAFTSVSSGSAVGNWTANGNPSGTEYMMQVSDDQGFASIIEASPWQTALSYEFTSLAPNTTYYGRVQARNGLNVATGYSTSESTLTLASVPGSGTFYGLAGDGFDIAWEANSNPDGTEYWVEISTESGFVPLTDASSWQTQRTYRFEGLATDTTYYAQVKARNYAGIETSYTNLESTKTLSVEAPDAPSEFEGVAISNTQVQFSWTDNAGDEDGFKIYTSTNGLLATLGADVTTWTDTGLTANTSSYAWQVRAYNVGGESGAAALGAVVYSSANVPSGACFSAIEIASGTFVWTANGNPSGTEYYTQISTDTNFGATSDSAWQTATSYQFTGLTPNTTYYGRVRARNGDIITTAYTTGVTTVTLANVPSSSAFTNITETSLRANWGSNSNPVDTEYFVEVSTDSGFVPVAGSSSWQTTLYYDFTSLDFDTTYYAQVKARSRAGIETAYTNLGSTKTLDVPVPSAPTEFEGVAISNTQVQFTWTDNAGDEDGFKIYTSTNGLLATLGADVTTWTDTGLTANTSSYAWQVRAYNIGGESGVAELGAVVYSSANVPSGAYFSAIEIASGTFVWTANGNPSGTEYYTQISTDTNFGATSDSAWQTATSYQFTGLTPNTTYYAHVKARNEDSVETAYTTRVSTITLANVPSSSAFTNITETSLRANWGSNSNPVDVEYFVEVSTDSGFVPVAGSSSWQTTLYYDFTGLGVNTTYYARVKARNRAGIETAYVTLNQTSTLSISITQVTPTELYRGVGTVITITGKGFETGASVSISGTGAAATVQSLTVVKIQALVNVADAAALGVRNVEVTNPDGTTKATKTGAVEVKGLKIAGYVKDKSDAGITGVLMSLHNESGKIKEATTTANGYYEFVELAKGVYSVYAEKKGYVFYGLQTNENVDIPVPLYSLNFEGIGIPTLEVTGAEVEEVKIYPGFTPTNAVEELIAVYRIKNRTNGPKRVKVNNESSIRRAPGSSVWIVYYNKKTSTWELAGKDDGTGLSGKIEQDAEYVAIARVNSEVLAGLSSGINVYPNPYIPSKHVNGVTFNGLKTEGSVKIYTIRGEMVEELEEDGTGRVVWYGVNEEGEKVGSGVYMCILETGSGNKVKKLGIER
ncbi:fibronectin type III domain-containing protein [bacterium]